LRRRPAVKVGRVARPGQLLRRGLDHLAQGLEAVGQLGRAGELPDGGHLLGVRVRVRARARARARARVRVRVRVRDRLGLGLGLEKVGTE